MKMFCSKCGAAVVGKYCSCCGARVRDQIEEFRLAEHRAERAFKHACTHNEYGWIQSGDRVHLAAACWRAAECKYGIYGKLVRNGYVPVEAYDELKTITMHAQRLFDQIVNF